MKTFSRSEFAAPIAFGVMLASATGAVRSWNHSRALAVLIEVGVLAITYIVSRFGRKSNAPAFGVALLVAIATVYLLASRDKVVASILLGLAQVVSGWIMARSSKRLLTPRLLWAEPVCSHLLIVARGSGIIRAEVWGAVYLCVAAAIATFMRSIQGSAGIPSEDVTLLLQDVHVSFGANEVLIGATLSCNSGEMLALAGANGSGKSTLLRVAAGLLQAPSVFLNSEDISMLDTAERTQLGVCFVSGAHPIFPELTVLQNLRVAASELNARAFRETTVAILEAVPTLDKRMTTKAGVLSGGEQRMLAVAQTLYRRPVVLIADELAAGLDTEARAHVLDMLRQIASSGCAVIIVDHDLPTLLPRCDRAALLRDGQVVTFEDPIELLESHSEFLPATFLAGV